MTISMTSMTTGSNLHGTMQVGPWDYARAIQSYFGTIGEYHLLGGGRGRELSAWMQFTGYASHSGLLSALTTLQGNTGEAGTVTITIGADSGTFTNCTFDGFTPEEDPWVDASGQNGWNLRGRLKWRQRAT
jgi:hypothetical protein